jgi:hypothetical protein
MSAIAQATAERHWYDLPYWLANFPGVRLNPEDNKHVDARSLRVPWTSESTPPIVAVEITPRYLSVPDKPQGLTFLPVLQAIAGIIPGVGPVVKAALTAASIGSGIATGLALQDWAKSFHASPDDFSPNYSPVAFTVPMPLDRAQIMVSRPWYAPAMVYQFQQELQTGTLRTTPEAYRALLQAMLPAGAADPAPYTQGEAPLFRFVNPLAFRIENSTEANEVNKAGEDPNSSVASLPSVQNQVSATPSALPILVAAGLLVVGAPVVLAALAGIALAGMGKSK